MHRAAAALGLSLLLACGQKEPDGVALVGATVIDGSGGPELPDAVVVVRGSRIESVGTRAGFKLPDRTLEVDVSGRWIIPGLVDAHVHLTDGNAGVLDWTLHRYLAYGVTTVRDVHGELGVVAPGARRAERRPASGSAGLLRRGDAGRDPHDVRRRHRRQPAG